MKAPIESSLRLEEVAEHFEQWRGGKKKGEWIPQQRWREAVGLLGTLWRLAGRPNPGPKRYRPEQAPGVIGAGQRGRGTEGKTAFVEIDLVVVDQARPETSAVWMELQRPKGGACASGLALTLSCWRWSSV